MFKWFFDWLSRREAYKAAFANAEAETERQRRNVVEAALAEATDTINRTRQEAVARGYESGKDEGYIAGRTKGRKDIEKEMRALRTDAEREARSLRENAYHDAYHDKATELGVLTHHDQTADRSEQFNTGRKWPNIYHFASTDRYSRGGGRYIVRVVANGERHAAAFDYRRQEDRHIALVEAMQYRDNRVGDDNVRMHVFREVVDELGSPDAAQPFAGLYRLADAYHQRLMETTLDPTDIEFLGDDPQDRLPGSDASLMVKPWEVVFDYNPSHRLRDAAERLGLTGRTVRDFLLLTGDDLTGVTNFGDVSLRSTQDSLAQFGMALWGDDPPVRPREPGERNFRNFDFSE